jgi:hypothetical protein
MAWMAVAVNQTAQWHGLARELTLSAGARAGLPSAWLWPVLWGSVAAAFAVRLTIEMRRSPLAIMLFWTGGLAWMAAVLVQPGMLDSFEPNARTMLLAGLTLTGQWTILWAHVAYARHVLLDAHGLIAPRVAPKRPRLAKKTSKASEGSESSVSAPAASVSRSAAAQARRANAAAAKEATSSTSAAMPAKTAAAAKPAAAPARLGMVADDEDADDEDNSAQGNSRAERKRLRRQQRGQMRDAA